MIYLSLCLPTNGISEWVFPVLDRIYQQGIDPSLYEVVVTDNGDNADFKQKMKEYAQKYDNIIFKEMDAYLFENQIEALRIAHGEYLKFINHRSLLEDGSLEWMIGLVKHYIDEKPVIYLSDGVLGLKESKEYTDFDGFVSGLKRYASWTTGVGVWRSDFEKIPVDWVYNKISPHSDVLFHERNRGKYIIDDRKWCHEIDSSHANKGKYDLYKTFAVEEISITLKLYLDGDISPKTLKSVIKDYKRFVAGCYWQFNVKHAPCSYKLDGFNDAMGVFMSKREIMLQVCARLPIAAVKKVYHMIRR